MAKFVEDLLPKLQEYIDLLNTPIYGRSIIDWFKLFLIYSFVVWLGIIAWRAFLFYQEYQKLENKRVAKVAQLNRLKRSIVYYKHKIREINVAYREISKTFSPKRVSQIERKLNELIAKIENKKRNSNLYQYAPYRLITFNYPLGLSGFFSRFEGVSLEGINFSAPSIYEYQNILQNIYSIYRKSKNGTLSGKIKIAFTDGKIALFLVKGRGLLSVNKIFLKGLIADAEKIPYFPTATYFYKTSEKLPNITRIFFGWDLAIKSEGLKQ